MNRIITTLVAAAICCSSNASFAADKLLEFVLKDKKIQGKVEVLGQSSCWLLERDGRMNRVKLKDVKSFHRTGDKFRPYRAAEMRDSLRREFGKEYEVAGSGQYLVCAPRGRAKQYAEMFDGIYRTFRVNFGARGFQLSSPEFPLVAVVLSNRNRFFAYQKQDGVPVNGQLLGYYHPTSNRVALFESGSSVAAKNRTSWLPASLTPPNGSRLDAYHTIQSNLEDTIIHEATHQVAFNTGLHSRIGDNPRWIVEGLATVFEADGVRDRSRSGSRSAKSRINRGRFIGFQNFVRRRRKPESLESFVASDEMLRRAPLDFYAQSWALSFYLMETRSRQYASYLKTVAARDPLKPYEEAARVADFKEAFGKDLAWLETGFLRFIDGLK